MIICAAYADIDGPRVCMRASDHLGVHSDNELDWVDEVDQSFEDYCAEYGISPEEAPFALDTWIEAAYRMESP